MSASPLWASALLLLLCAPASAQPASCLIRTTYGPVQGEEVSGVRVWRSIPFAADPVGALRFQAPQPPAPWTAVKDVRGYATPCAQLKLLGPLLYGGEACLQLAVYAPPAAPAAPPKPVLFWIYGGAYVLGDEEELGWYDAVNLVQAHPEMLVVAANYRLGPLGFMALDSLKAENGNTGNAALLDQVAALEWVRDNIAAFGGDPARVTIAGESAGAFSVAWHLASPRSAGLFQGAILESGTLDAAQFFQPLPDAVAFNSLYAAALGCPRDASGSDAPQAACMRALSVDAMLIDLAEALNPDWPCITPGRCPPGVDAAAAHLRTGARTLPALAPVMPWGPAIDGVLLSDLPLHAVQRGAFNKVNVLLGTNRNEGSIFIPIFPIMVPNTTFPPRLADIPSIVEHAYNMYDSALVRNLTNTLILPAYSVAAYNNDTWAMTSDLLTHAFFACATRRAARALAAPSRAPSVHLYEFSFDLARWPEVAALPQLGNYHTSELDFVFGNTWPSFLHGANFTQEEAFMSAAFQAYWANFVVSGNPNTGSAAPPLQWPPFVNGDAELNLQLELPLNVVEQQHDEICSSVWDPFAQALEASQAGGARSASERSSWWAGRLAHAKEA